MMTHATLQALRRLLFYSIPEAAEHIGQRSERAWRMWERGELPVPDDVAQRMRDLVAWRARAIEAARGARAEADAVAAREGETPAGMSIAHYDSLDAFMARGDIPAAYWRPHCSAVAELIAEGTISEASAA